ncbi:MAG: hypothetical protein M1827_003551 [Pycnora praestabilis]|nr:MAG: hypothetical protein M1827_003551 [Pycnora praestabilis]
MVSLLPNEIVMKIFEEALMASEPVVFDHNTTAAATATPKDLTVAVLRLSKDYYKKLAPVLYQDNTFSFCDDGLQLCTIARVCLTKGYILTSAIFTFGHTSSRRKAEVSMASWLYNLRSIERAGGIRIKNLALRFETFAFSMLYPYHHLANGLAAIDGVERVIFEGDLDMDQKIALKEAVLPDWDPSDEELMEALGVEFEDMDDVEGSDASEEDVVFAMNANSDAGGAISGRGIIGRIRPLEDSGEDADEDWMLGISSNETNNGSAAGSDSDEDGNTTRDDTNGDDEWVEVEREHDPANTPANGVVELEDDEQTQANVMNLLYYKLSPEQFHQYRQIANRSPF